MKRLLLASTSTVHGRPYLDYLKEEVLDHFRDRERLFFIPFARPGGMSHDQYAALACGKFAEWGLKMEGLHRQTDLRQALAEADGVFTGGGNTFVLLKELYDSDLLGMLRQRVEEGMAYMGSSAGSNLAGMSVGTTNDMPIVHPPSLEALGAVPFNINPHYLDPDPNSTHMGETRETRIKEFHAFNSQGVLGLREGSWLRVQDDAVELCGPHTARWFTAGQEAVELAPGLLKLG